MASLSFSLNCHVGEAVCVTQPGYPNGVDYVGSLYSPLTCCSSSSLVVSSFPLFLSSSKYQLSLNVVLEEADSFLLPSFTFWGYAGIVHNLVLAPLLQGSQFNKCIEYGLHPATQRVLQNVDTILVQPLPDYLICLFGFYSLSFSFFIHLFFARCLGACRKQHTVPRLCDF